MRKFIRVKATLDQGWSRWLAKDKGIDGFWLGEPNKKDAYEFKNKREVFEVLLRLGGQWLDRGRLVHVITRPKVSNESR